LEYIEDLPAAERKELEVPREILGKPFAQGLSYAQPHDVRTFCFTGHYGKVWHKSSGSLLFQSAPWAPRLDKTALARAHGAVRLFSPKEILNVLGFPASFVVPPSLQLRHRYKAVGNSIAVTVAARLLRVLLLGEDETCLGLPRCELERAGCG